MKIRNVSPLGDLQIDPRGQPGLEPGVGGVLVAAGAVIDLPDDVAAGFLAQPDVWVSADDKADKPTKSKEVAA